MTPTDRAFKALGLTDAATPRQVSDAYRELSKTAHPDVGGDQDAFDVLTRARDLALEYAVQPRTCAACGGSGKRATRGAGFHTVWTDCEACAGLGTVGHDVGAGEV